MLGCLTGRPSIFDLHTSKRFGFLGIWRNDVELAVHCVRKWTSRSGIQHHGHFSFPGLLQRRFYALKWHFQLYEKNRGSSEEVGSLLYIFSCKVVVAAGPPQRLLLPPLANLHERRSGGGRFNLLNKAYTHLLLV